MSEVMWEPDSERVGEAMVTAFLDVVPPATYDELWDWSVDNPGEFWGAVWDFCDVVGDRGSLVVSGTGMFDTRWFPDARLNYAENLLRHPDDRRAVVGVDESGSAVTLTRAELAALVGRVQRSFADLGVQKGDRVAGLMSNGIEALVAMLATAALGAAWSSCSPDFGPMGVVDRFGQIDPKVLVSVDGYRYNGKTFDLANTLSSVVGALDGLEAVALVDVVGSRPDLGDMAVLPWDDVAGGPPAEPEFTRVPFDHPLFIMYSSGTTGPPKSIVHGVGGTLLKHLCEHQLHSDVRPGDTAFWFTTCGWMMWNWLVSALASESALVLYDGSPSHPDLGALWRLAADVGITHFGTSPKFLAANENAGIEPASIADLGGVRWLGSTGAPLNPAQFDWVYGHVSDDVQLASISGGTDIIGCFALGAPTLPVRRGELQSRALGMAVAAFDDSGEPGVGRKGELVCTAPFPSMPVGFWNDPDGSRYRAAYFEQFPDVWTHGDFIEITPEGGVVIYGRSDTTLNPGGVRIGTAEIYRSIEAMAEVDDAVVVGRETGGDVEVVLCVVLAAGVELDDRLVAAVKDRIRTQTSPRHVPRWVFAVDAVPYTISGKKVEKAVARTIAGEVVVNREALANPDALDQYTNLAF
ncbi:MAG: acetoacetate--CoA ligase [Acidimicrobiia bacterium]|nr:acetoacetate--CoA ligase [Acidimicrobiia bacterium]